MDVCGKKESLGCLALCRRRGEIDGDDWWAEACSLLSSDGGCSSAEAGTRRDAAEGGTTACDSMMACAAEPITVDGVEGDLLRAVEKKTRCPALGASPWGGCLQLHLIRCGRATTAPCAWRLSAHHGPRRMRTRVLRRVAGTARTRYAAAAMLTYSVLRTASAPCAGRLAVSTCIPDGVGGRFHPPVPAPRGV